MRNFKRNTPHYRRSWVTNVFCILAVGVGLCIGGVGLSIAYGGGERDIYTYTCLALAAMLYFAMLCLCLIVLGIHLLTPMRYD